VNSQGAGHEGWGHPNVRASSATSWHDASGPETGNPGRKAPREPPSDRENANRLGVRRPLAFKRAARAIGAQQPVDELARQVRPRLRRSRIFPQAGALWLEWCPYSVEH